MKERWTPEHVPSLDGKVIVVTGANSGIGYEAARVFARAGAEVIFAGRSREKNEEAVGRLRTESPAAKVAFRALDLSSLSSVRGFAEGFSAAYSRLDVLVNNAGIMGIPRRLSADGFETQFATNHLGHFALTGLLLPRLAAAAPSRVVTVSSAMHHRGRMRFDDLQGEKSYSAWARYADSKLANVLFGLELERRLRARGLDVKSVMAHPGYAATNLQQVGPRESKSAFSGWIMRMGNAYLAQSAEAGAWPTEYAAVSPDVDGGDYIGPGGMFEMKGPPAKAKINPRGHDVEAARRLWEISEQLTGVGFEALAGAAG